MNDITTKEYKQYLQLQIQKYEIDMAENLKIIADARSQGDLKENAGYHQARDDHRQLEDLMLSCQTLLNNSSTYIFDENNKKAHIDFGAYFTIELNDKSCEYLLLDDAEAIYEKNIISLKSPLGQLFLNKKVNDIIEFPNEILNYSIRINKNRIERLINGDAQNIIIKKITYKSLEHLYSKNITEIEQFLNQKRISNTTI